MTEEEHQTERNEQSGQKGSAVKISPGAWRSGKINAAYSSISTRTKSRFFSVCSSKTQRYLGSRVGGKISARSRQLCAAAGFENLKLVWIKSPCKSLALIRPISLEGALYLHAQRLVHFFGVIIIIILIIFSCFIFFLWSKSMSLMRLSCTNTSPSETSQLTTEIELNTD